MGHTPPCRTTLLEALSVHLGLLAWLITRQLAQQLRSFDLTLPQFIVLTTLSDRRNPCSMGQIARLAQQTPATLTGIVDRLIKEGLVQRIGSETDRRRVLIQATPAGLNLVEKVQAECLQTISNSFVPLADETLFAVEQSLASVLLAYTEKHYPLLAAGFNDEPQKFLLTNNSIPA